MSGKYDHILKDLPKLPFRPTEDAAVHQVRIDATKAVIAAPRNGDDAEPLNDLQRSNALRSVEVNLKTLHKDLARSLAGEPLTAAALVRAWRDVRDLKDRLADLVSNTSLLVSAFEQLMVAAMDAEDTKSLKLLDGRGVVVRYEPYVKVTDPEALRVWCEADPDLRLKMRLLPATLASHVRQMLLQGEEPPPGTEVSAAVPVVSKQGNGEG